MKRGIFSNKILLACFILLPLTTLISVGMEVYFHNAVSEIERNIQQSDLKSTHELAVKLSQRILQNSPKDIVATLAANKLLRGFLEEDLALMHSSQYSYIYVLYFDSRKKLRYLLDGSRDPQQHGDFNQRFGDHHPLWKKHSRAVCPKSSPKPTSRR